MQLSEQRKYLILLYSMKVKLILPTPSTKNNTTPILTFSSAYLIAFLKKVLLKIWLWYLQYVNCLCNFVIWTVSLCYLPSIMYIITLVNQFWVLNTSKQVSPYFNFSCNLHVVLRRNHLKYMHSFWLYYEFWDVNFDLVIWVKELILI